MFTSYLKTSLRNILRNKLFSAINILGLTIGMAGFILIMLWVNDELSFDKFHDNSENVYRLIGELNSGRDFKAAVTPAPAGPFLKESISEIMQYVRLRPFDDVRLVKVPVGDSLDSYKSFYESSFIFVDSTFFEVFTFPLKYGNPASALGELNSILISEEIAKKYFGNENPVGKVINIIDWNRFNITGVFENVPQNSHLKFDFILPFDLLENYNVDTGWGHYWFNNYFQLFPGSNIDEVNEKIMLAIKPNLPEDLELNLYLQVLTDIHLKSDMDIDLNDNESHITNDVYYFSIIAVFILLIACVNFMNLTTANAFKRYREIGLRKVIGAEKKDIIIQFVGEAIIISMISLLTAVVIVELLLPVFNTFLEKSISLNLQQVENILFLIGLSLITGIIAGCYPALYLSSFRPTDVINSGKMRGSGKGQLRKILFAFQIFISVGLIIATFVVFDQLEFIKNKELGYNKDNLVYLPARGNLLVDFNQSSKELLENPSIESFTISSDIPLTNIHLWNVESWEGKDDDTPNIMYFYMAGFDFLETMGITIKEGRSFSMTTDSNSYIINQAAADYMGMTDPLGKWISRGNNKGRIIGVVEDFHFKSLKTDIEPLIIQAKGYYNYLIARLVEGRRMQGIAALESFWKKKNSDYPFEYHFLENDLNKMYQDEHKKGIIFKYFTFLAIFIACLGLLGFIIYTLEYRAKELAIRKVLGSGNMKLFSLLSKDFTKLTIIGNFIAWPVIWFIMKKWLDNFQYHIPFSVKYFIFALLISVLIIFITMSLIILKAVSINLADTLKSE